MPVLSAEYVIAQKVMKSARNVLVHSADQKLSHLAVASGVGRCRWYVGATVHESHAVAPTELRPSRSSNLVLE